MKHKPHTQPDAIVEISELDFYRGDRQIFQGVNLSIKKGSITAIMGPSGTGKTTLLRLMGGQLSPHRGTVTVMGENVSQLNRKALYVFRRKLGVLFQSGALFTGMNVFDNVAFPLREHTDLPESMIRDVVLMKLNAVGLRGARDLLPVELSGGMARRVALARAIAMDPQLIFYDEPFAGQDPISMGVLVQLIKRLNDALGTTSVIVSHDVSETASIADYVYVVSEGRVVAEGTPEDIAKEENPYAKQFLRGLPDGVVPFHYPAPTVQADFMGEQA